MGAVAPKVGQAWGKVKSFFGGGGPAPAPVVPAEAANLSSTTANACFVAGTEVLMGDGSSKSIEDVVVGDEVLAWNAVTGVNEPKRVVETFVHEDVETWEVETTDGLVMTTAEHPFHVEGAGWTPAKDLRPGDVLATATGTLEVVRAERTGAAARVFNFHVDDLHNYHVRVEQHWLRVHNNCGGGSPSFVVTSKGEAIIVPEDATGPTLTNNGKGFQFTGGSGGHGLHPTVSDVRIMDPNSMYPTGRVTYMNSGNQAVNPFTGRTLAKSDPYWHWSLK